MMITFTNLNELKTVHNTLQELKKDYPVLFVKFLDVVNLTRAFQFKYHYLRATILDEDPGENKPKFVYGSVLRVYKKEVQKLKDDTNFHVFKEFLMRNQSTDFMKICLLALGTSPDSLVGTSCTK